MKKLLLTLFLMGTSTFLYRCTEVEYVDHPPVEPIFTESAQQNGEFFADILLSTAREIHSKKINLTNGGLIFDISQSLTLNSFQQRGLITTPDNKGLFDKNSKLKIEHSEKAILDYLIRPTTLTSSQQRIIDRIQKVQQKMHIISRIFK